MTPGPIPAMIYTKLFLRFAEAKAKEFKQQNGFGRWLAEYQRMEDAGQFEALELRRQLINILKGQYNWGFICGQAVWCICVRALTAVEEYDAESIFDIRFIDSGEIALDDDENDLMGLSLEDAVITCRKMNAENGILYTVYDSDLDEIIM